MQFKCFQAQHCSLRFVFQSQISFLRSSRASSTSGFHCANYLCLESGESSRQDSFDNAPVQEGV